MKTSEFLRPFLPLIVLAFLTTASCQLVTVPGSAPSQGNDPWANQSGWSLAWHDEFDGPALDPTKWAYDSPDAGSGNGEQETYSQANASIETVQGNSCLVLTAENNSGAITSARLKTQGLFSAASGRIEARMLLPYGKGMWPAFWMLGTDIPTVSWPACGEIDIMEMVGGTGSNGTAPLSDSTSYGTLHYTDATFNAGAQVQPMISSLAHGKYADAFHVWGVEWTSSAITWFVDGVASGSTSILPPAVNAGVTFQSPFFLLLNLAVGGTWPGNYGPTTVFPQTLAVDWVRVYTKS